MAESCGFVNQHGIACGLGKHPSSVPHELYVQSVEPDPFCLRATDPIALSTIRAWILTAIAYGVNPAKIQKAEEHFNEIKRWQRTHTLKTPD